MDSIDFNQTACERTRNRFDSYLDNELPFEAIHDVLRHLDVCSHCTRVLENRASLIRAVQQAVMQQQVPLGLRGSIESNIRGRLPWRTGRNI